jgi:hypothetical protein
LKRSGSEEEKIVRGMRWKILYEEISWGLYGSKN